MKFSTKLGWVVASVSLAVLLAGTAADGTGAGIRARSNPYSDFPLWKDVPGKSFAMLEEGSLPNRTRWGVYASNGADGPGGRKFPCLTVATITSYGEYRYAHPCAKPAPEPGRPPVVVAIGGSGPRHPGGPVIGEAAVGASFVPKVRKAELLFSSGERVIRRTRLLNGKQQLKTNLLPFRYVAFATMRDVCVTSIIGYDASGKKLFGLPTEQGC